MSAVADHAARVDIATALDQNLFVEAGAGTGKTHELVGRVVALIRSGIDVRELAVITFTEAAAADSPGTLPRARSAIEYRASTKREKYPTRASRPRPALKALVDSLRSFARLRNTRRRPP